MILHNIQVTGSLVLNGVDLNDVTGSEASVAALNEFTSSYNTGSFTGSFIGDGSGVFGIVSASHALNADNAISSSFAATASFADSFTVAGEIVAQTLNVQQVTSSVVYSSGSNVFGNDISNTQQFTGSLQVSGSTHYLLGNVGINTVPSFNLHNTGTFGFATDITGNIGVLGANTNTADTYFSIRNTAGRFDVGTSATGHYFYGVGALPLQFFTNSTERMRIDSSGNVGIGTSTPNYFVDIESEGAAVRVFNLTSNDNTDFYLNTTGTTGASRILFGDTGSSGVGKILYRHNGDSMAFETGGSEAMRITSSGFVGIGTTTPNDLLYIKSTTTDARMVLDGATGFDAELKFFENGAAKYTVGYDAATGNFVIGTTNVDTNQRLVIDSSGNVGIGTTSPSAKLHIHNGEAIIATSTDGLKLSYSVSNSSGIIDTAFSDNNLEFRTNGTAKMWIANGGNVGIGTTSPSYKLHILGSSADTVRYDNGTNFLHNFIDVTGVYFNTDASNFRFLLNSGVTEAMRIDASGNVGIGTTSPGYKLDISGISAGLNFSGGNNRIYFGSARAIEGDGTSLQIGEGHATTYIQTSTNSTVMTITGDKVGIGTVSPNQKLTVASVDPNGTGVYRDLDVGVVGDAGVYINLGARSGSTFTEGARVVGVLSSNAADGFLNFDIRSGGTLTERMRITTAGNVGIGTTSPSNKLEVAGVIAAINSGNTTIQARSTNTFPLFQLIKDGGATWNLEGGREGNSFGIYESGASTRFVISTGGNVGIGTTSPSFKLSVVGAIQANELYLNGSYTNSYSTTDAGWNGNWVTVIPPDTLDTDFAYLVSFKWTNNGAGQPYELNGASIMMTANTNSGSGTGTEIYINSISHTGGTDNNIQIRSSTGASQVSNGLQIKLTTSGSLSSGTLYVKATRMMQA